MPSFLRKIWSALTGWGTHWRGQMDCEVIYGLPPMDSEEWLKAQLNAERVSTQRSLANQRQHFEERLAAKDQHIAELKRILTRIESRAGGSSVGGTPDAPDESDQSARC